LEKGLKKLIPLDEIEAIMDFVDTDKNGAINFNEFIAATLNEQIL
jgi:Ca2+-binding EF-hand superfamily protein